jgi:hypothetical protein
MNRKKCRIIPGIIFLMTILIFRFNIVFSQADLPDSVILQRLQVIEEMFIRGKPNVDLWYYGWIAGYSGATVGQGILAIKTNNESLRQDMILGAATTLLGTAGQIITPMAARNAHKLFSGIPENTHEERMQKLNKAEELLKECARNERSGRSWQVHAVTGVVNLCSGLITWQGFKRDLWAGVQNFALNTVITEAQIWTQPTRAMKDYENYCRLYKSGETPVASKPGVTWFVSATPGGAKLMVLF